MISIDDFLRLMEFPEEWVAWKMIPEDLMEVQLKNYRPGDEQGAEHDRNGAFHWWLKRDPSKEHLMALVKLSFLDPDQIMSSDVRKYIVKARLCDQDVLNLIDKLANAKPGSRLP